MTSNTKNNFKDSKQGSRVAKILSTAGLADVIQVNKWWGTTY